MRFTRIEVIGYKRLALNAINHIVITPTNPLQLVLGTNGSGKSSLLRLLTPLPADKDGFHKGGLVRLDIRRHDDEYIITNDFKDSARYSFIKNGVELNSTGKITIQRGLAEETFGVTTDVWRLLMGYVSFSKMSANERRQWFSRLSVTDYTYATQVYNNLKEVVRDGTGAIKAAKTKLAYETTKLVTDETLTCLVADMSIVQKHIDDLRSLMPARTTPPPSVLPRLRDATDSFRKEYTSALKQIKRLGLYVSDVDVASGLDDCKAQMAVCDAALRTIESDISDTETTLGSSCSDKSDILNHLDSQRTAITTEIDNAINTLPDGWIDIGIDETHYADLMSVVPRLVETVASIPSNTDGQHTRAKADALAADLATMDQSIRKLETSLSINHKHLATLSKVDDTPVTCPACTHVFSRDNSSAIVECNATIEHTKAQLVTMRDQRNEINKSLATTTAYLETIKDITIMSRHTPRLAFMWDMLIRDRVVSTNPDQIQYYLDTVIGHVRTILNIREMSKTLASITERIDTTSKMSETNIAELTTSLTALRTKRDATLDTKRRIAHGTQRIQDYIKVKALVSKLVTDHTATMNGLNQDFVTIANNDLAHMLNNMIASAQSALDTMANRVSSANTQSAIVASIRTHLTQLEARTAISKVMAKCAFGMISEGMSGFVSAFVVQMNAVIDTIWQYPMSVQPCAFDPDTMELSYEFPILVNDTDTHAEGSSAMQEIIDLAFKLTAMKYLDLLDYPLFLDEFGKSLDTGHRRVAFDSVMGLRSEQAFPQIFVVSHFEECYATLAGAETLVLSTTNIDIPKGMCYNEHVVIA